MSSSIVIEVRDLTKRFGSFTAVDAISFSVRRGEIFGFLGANGAGKTTAMKMLIGISSPTHGSATVAGYDVIRQPDMVKKNIGYMSQRFSLYEDLRVIENIRFFGGIYGLHPKELRTVANDIIDQLNMRDARDKLVADLPLGWRQKLSFAIAMMHRPAIVFLDEPTGGVDPITRRQFWERIYQAANDGTTVFVTTHYMDEAEYCHCVSIMVDGRIEAMDSPAQLKSDFGAQSMDEVFHALARKAQRGDM
jgi:ABC-2 type transport system ATP-binding protein